MEPTIWYRVRDLDGARRFYREQLGFTETFVDDEARWARLEHGGAKIALAEGEPQGTGGVAHVAVDDIRAAADRLRAAGVEVGVVVELHGQMRLLEVQDPDGNRIELGEDLT